MADIKNSLNFIKKTTTDCNLITICPSRKNPYFNMVEIDKTKKIKIIKSIQKKIISARQSAPKVFEVNAGIYIWKRSFLINNNKLINSHTRYFVTPYERSIDIDSKIDLKIAEFLFKNKKYR